MFTDPKNLTSDEDDTELTPEERHRLMKRWQPWIQHLVRQFAALRPIRFFRWSPPPLTSSHLLTTFDPSECLLESFQEIFMDAINSLPYAPCESYVRRFLKTYVNQIESAGHSLSSALLERYMDLTIGIRHGAFTTLSRSQSLCSNPDPQPETSFKTYTLNDETSITLIESIDLIVNGETGLRTWEASLYMTDFIIQNPFLFTGHTILELGSGIGLVGLTLHRLTDAKRIILSDGRDDVLSMLQENVLRNTNVQKQSVDVVKVPWQESLPTEIMKLVKEVSVVVACDCVYNLEDIPHFASLLEVLFRTTKRRMKAYIATAIRRPETFEMFLSCLLDLRIEWRFLSDLDADNVVLFHDYQETIVVLELTAI